MISYATLLFSRYPCLVDHTQRGVLHFDQHHYVFLYFLMSSYSLHIKQFLTWEFSMVSPRSCCLLERGAFISPFCFAILFNAQSLFIILAHDFLSLIFFRLAKIWSANFRMSQSMYWHFILVYLLEFNNIVIKDCHD